jgi:dUTP pyrophosphatase
MKLPFKKLDPRAVAPTMATHGAACFDVVAITRQGNVYGTGLAFEVPHGYVLKAYSRSGHGFKHNTRLANCVGIIDSDYRGELMVKLTRDDGKRDIPHVGDRVCQIMLEKLVKTEMIEVDELNKTERGENGLGSTGA